MTREETILEQEPCEDAISRQAVIQEIKCWIGSGEYRYAMSERFLVDRIKTLPSVNPTKTGHWIEDDMTYCGVELVNYKCDKCGEIGGSWRKGLKPDELPKYCMNCGCRML